MDKIKRNAMLYRAVNADCHLDFEKSYFEQDFSAIITLSDWAELCNLRPRNGWTPARTLFTRLKDYEIKHVRNK